jgi:hypothetical protein
MIMTLVQKQGDPMNIKNWRPITLINTNYKLITQRLTNTITTLLLQLIYLHQSSCVPGRSIHKNLHLIRDVRVYANTANIPPPPQPTAISSDQVSAYNSVEQNYLHLLLPNLDSNLILFCILRWYITEHKVWLKYETS